MNALRPNGVLCFVGAPSSDDPAAGSAADWRTTGDLRVEYGEPERSLGDARRGGTSGVKAITESFAMAKASDAVSRVKKNQVRYRAVRRIKWVDEGDVRMAEATVSALLCSAL